MNFSSIALVWNAKIRLIDITTRFEPYAEGFRALGIRTITVCPAGMEDGYQYPAQTFTDYKDLTRAAFWQDLKCEAAMIITWHRMTDILLAMREAGVRSLALLDSDGQVSCRYHPLPTLRFATYLQPTFLGKIGALKYWLMRRIFQSNAEHQALVENADAACVTTMPGEGPLEVFQLFLRAVGAGKITKKVAWLPYPVEAIFSSSAVPVNRPRRVIAVGRWDSPQKDPALLAAVAEIVATAENPMEILIVGRGGDFFGPLAALNPKVKILGVLTKNEITELMATSRFVLVPSRWEGSPIVANEMLAMGGTVVGSPIPALEGITAKNLFGRVSRSRRPSDLARAAFDEMDAWEQGERDPAAIAAYWRTKVSPVGVARRMLELLGNKDQSKLELSK